MKELGFVNVLSRLERAESLDPLSDRITSIFNALVRPRWLRDVLHGVPVGHPVHPVAVMIPIGCWTSAAILDLVPGMQPASRLLIAAGLAGVGASSLTGFTDWSELHEQHKRVGVIHAAANVVASGLYVASFLRRGQTGAGNGKVLALMGLAVVSASGFIGGHLSFRQAAGANHAEAVPHLFPVGWQRLAPLESLPLSEAISVEVSGQSLLAVRHADDSVDVLSNICSHLSGPLADGVIVRVGADACIQCPWHQSEFSLRTGAVVHGPATAPQPRFDTRVIDGVVEVSLPGAG